MGSIYCKTCIHRKDWFKTEVHGISNFTYESPFQDITDAETGDKQVFISKMHPCYRCKYIFDEDNYEEDIRKCPFCGSAASICAHDRGDHPGSDYSVCCDNPKCGIETGLYETKREAITVWNRRT